MSLPNREALRVLSVKEQALLEAFYDLSPAKARQVNETKLNKSSCVSKGCSGHGDPENLKRMSFWSHLGGQP